MMIRAFIFFVLFIVAVTLPTPVLAVCALAYAFRYTAYELIILAVVIDAYYGLGFSIIPYYTLTVCFCLILIEWIKPRISVYNQ